MTSENIFSSTITKDNLFLKKSSLLIHLILKFFLTLYISTSSIKNLIDYWKHMLELFFFHILDEYNIKNEFLVKNNYLVLK